MSYYSNPKQGEVYLVDFYFRDLNQYKLRPAVIISGSKAIDIDVVTAPITSKEARNEFDVPIIKWKEAGLEYESVARTSKPLSFSKVNLRRKLGELKEPDLTNVLKKSRDVYDQDSSN